MGGNRVGGLKVRDSNLAKDPDYYKHLGYLGGTAYKSKPHGFMCMTPQQRSAAGRKGGSISRRGKSVV